MYWTRKIYFLIFFIYILQLDFMKWSLYVEQALGDEK